MAETKYSFVKLDSEAGLLEEEIRRSNISTTLDRIMTTGDALDIYFVNPLSGGDETILNTVVVDHDVYNSDVPFPTGQGDEFGIDDSESTTSSKNYQEKLRYGSSRLPAGKYEIKWSFELGNTKQAKESEYRVRIYQVGTDEYTTLAEAMQEANKNGSYHPVSGFTELELDEDIYEIVVEYKRAAHTAKIRRVRVNLRPTTR